MAESKISYATSTAITCTLASLADTNARLSADVDNGTNEYVDASVYVKVKTGAAPSSDGYVEVWFLGGHAAVGGDAAYTINGIEVLAGVFDLDAANESITTPIMSVASAFGGIMPDHWAVAVVNQSGATLSATGGDHEIKYQGITYTDA
jgi:hypothetical protein